MPDTASLPYTPCQPVGRCIGDGEVHAWWGSVDDDHGERDGHLLLSTDEFARAGRLWFERDRMHFVHRRVFLRTVLASYLGTVPANVPLRISRWGRPELDRDIGLSFNASCSDGMAVVVVAAGRSVGVDVERLRRLDDTLGLADGLFAPRELELLRSIAEPARSATFLTMCTRKEALVKAAGVGLSVPLDDFEVLDTNADGVGQARILDTDPMYAFTGNDAPAGYIGSIAVGGSVGRGVQVQARQWTTPVAA